MPDIPDIDTIRSDPDFAKLSPAAKLSGLKKIYGADPDFGKMSPTAQEAALRKMYPELGPTELHYGSVMEPPEPLVHRLGRYGKEAARLAVGTAVPVGAGLAAGALVGPEATGPVKAATQIGTQALGGAVEPYAEYSLSKIFGEEVAPPTGRDVMRSSVINAAFAGLGELGAAATKSASVGETVASELEKFPPAERTVGKIKQIKEKLGEMAAEEKAVSAQDLRNRDFWKAHGLNDAQIDEVLKTPEVQKELAARIEQGTRYKAAYNTVGKVARADYTQRYTDILGPHAEMKFDVVPLGQEFEQLGQGAGQHELTPTFRGFLQRKGLELTRAGEAVGPSVGGVPWKQLPESFKERLRAQAPEVGIAVPGADFGIQDLRDLRTELGEQLPSNATPLDKKAYQHLRTQIDQLEETQLKKGGATPEQIGSLKALDQEWGRFSESMRALDPTSEKYGAEVANKLFDPMIKKPGAALTFIDLAHKAEAVNPGVMGDLREAFLQRAMRETRVAGEPMQELKLLRKLQEQWGGDSQARAVMGAMFGKDSPLADPATFSRVVEATSNVEPLALKARQTWSRNILNSPYFQGMILLGLASGMAGMKGGGVFSALTGQRGPEVQMMAIASLLAGPKLVGFVVRSGNSPLQKAAVEFLTNPSAENAVRYAGKIAGGVGGAMTYPASGAFSKPVLPSPASETPPTAAPNPLPAARPNPEATPLPKLAVSWKTAPPDAREPMKAEMTARILAGEWKRLSQQERQALGPVLAEMYRIKKPPELGANA